MRKLATRRLSIDPRDFLNTEQIENDGENFHLKK